MTNEEFQNRVLGQLSAMQTDMTGVKQQLSAVQEDLSGVKGQLSENTDILRALEHRSEINAAAIEGLTLATARIEGEIKNIRSDINTIEAVTAKNWTDITQLKAVK